MNPVFVQGLEVGIVIGLTVGTALVLIVIGGFLKRNGAVV